MDFTPEEIRRFDAQWKSDTDLKLDRLVRFVENFDKNHAPFLATLMEREKERAEFWKAMRQHVGKMGAWSIVSAIGYAAWLGVKALLKAA